MLTFLESLLVVTFDDKKDGPIKNMKDSVHSQDKIWLVKTDNFIANL